jgi:hypothetical protein
MAYRVECFDCKDLIDNALEVKPDKCGNKEALEYHQSLHPDKKIILYCTDVNKNNDCKFVRLKFSGLVAKFFSD